MIARLLGALLLIGCGGAPSPFVSPIAREHPLVGRIWSSAARRFVTEDELRQAVSGAELVLVGEKHDNADHQRLEARIVGFSQAHTLVMEMIEIDHDPAVAQAHDASSIAVAANWSESGWPPFDQYRPVVEAALGAGMRIEGGNVPTRSVMALARGEPLTEEVAPLLAEPLAAPPPDASVAQAMAEEMRDAHCGMLPERAMAGMARVQWIRDELMAERLAAARPAVLVAGAGHVRSDRGVPLHLARLAAGARVITIALREVDPSSTTVEESPYDYVWLTPIATDEDPCAALRAAHHGKQDRPLVATEGRH